MITTKIVWDRKKRANKNGLGTLEVRVTTNRRTSYYSTGVRVRANEWKAGQIVNRPDADALNERLAIIVNRIYSETNRCLRDGEAPSSEDIRQKVWLE